MKNCRTMKIMYLVVLIYLKAMDEVECKNIIFSSSATVYGNPKYLPLDENHPCKPNNTYGDTKFMIEKIIKDWCKTDNKNKSVILVTLIRLELIFRFNW